MGYVGPKLAQLFDPAPAEDAAGEIAYTIGHMLGDHVAMLTPVQTGRLRAGWEVSHVRKVSMVTYPAYVVTVSNSVEYARDVEFGTGLWGPAGMKYPIEAKKPGGVLTWITRTGFIDRRTGHFVPPGTRVFARRVMHPGSEGHHMMAKAMAWVDANWQDHARPALDAWVERTEMLFMRAQVGVHV